mmetsp:Transcript_5622/g.9778  ORF Transcript_5622/g.9778 Transcript_5622/m.9778 type:complete len:211 (+) Transcript_5622:15-647(+)
MCVRYPFFNVFYLANQPPSGPYTKKCWRAAVCRSFYPMGRSSPAMRSGCPNSPRTDVLVGRVRGTVSLGWCSTTRLGVVEEDAEEGPPRFSSRVQIWAIVSCNSCHFCCRSWVRTMSRCWTRRRDSNDAARTLRSSSARRICSDNANNGSANCCCSHVRWNQSSHCACHISTSNFIQFSLIAAGISNSTTDGNNDDDEEEELLLLLLPLL